MSDQSGQPMLPGLQGTPDKEEVKKALDELFELTLHYNDSKSFDEFRKFVGHFRFYSPYNAMLIHIQMPGAKFVAPASRWIYDFRRAIKPNARPIVILQPMGPVMFVFDVSDTEPTDYSKPLPSEVDKPFDVKGGKIGGKLDKIIENAKRDGIRVLYSSDGSQSAGFIRRTDEKAKKYQVFKSGIDKKRNPIYVNIEVKYDVVINEKVSREAQFVTLAHELAHLYCGHIGSPDIKWWPRRQTLDKTVREFEAESVAYLVCTRLNIENPSENYLAGYLGENKQVPKISLESVMKSAGLIENMTKKNMKPRKKTE